ncbi:MAG: ATP-dependent helicase [Candidatus Roizmanbacteria bacterium]|nr:ATP-dependent helicase [Candidatus Roizmanbacteria bacterium]
MKPNKEQLAAIAYHKGPSLIIAGAGTGKTFVITNKIVSLINAKKVLPQQIVALTFTEKAAYEMEQRVDELLPYGFYQLWIMTFHSFAESLLQEYGIHMGIAPSFRVITDVDAVSLFRTRLGSMKLTYFHSTGNPHGFISSALTHFSRLRDEGISVAQYKAYVESLKPENEEEKQEAQAATELAYMYGEYETLKREKNVLDFSDLTYYLVELLRNKPSILKQVRERFRYGFVDEFQDTNIIQYELMKLLFPPSKNPQLTVIGDDNQSIYKFRGASISNILNFQHDYRDAKQFILNHNYRSHQPILDASYAMIQHNNPDTLEATLGISKKLITTRTDTQNATEVEVLYATHGQAEAEKVVDTIKHLVADNGYVYGDMALLVRAHDHAKLFMQAFEQAHIPFQTVGPGLLYYRNEIRDLIALLRFLENPLDSISLYRILSMDVMSFSHKDTLYLMNFAKKTGRSLFEAMDASRALSQGELSPELENMKRYAPLFNAATKAKVERAQALLLTLLEDSRTHSVTQVVYDFLDKSGYLKLLTTIESTEDQRRLDNITRFYKQLKALESEGIEPTVRDAITHIDLSLELGDSPTSGVSESGVENAVTIATIHGSKGLEFNIVFLANMVSDRFPSRNRKEALPIPEALIRETLPSGDAHMQEERRLCYVGMTRAKDRLYLSFSHYYGSGKRKKKPSPFIVEAIGEKKLQNYLGKLEESESQLSIFDMGVAPGERNEMVVDDVKKYGIVRYSYSQIDTYTTCPLQYRYRYMLRIPEPDAPALSFGSSIHRALELFYQHIRDGGTDSKEQLLSSFEHSFIPVGYSSRDERLKAKEHGKEILARYYDTFHAEHGEPVVLERMFSLTLASNTKGKRYVISGKIDRIDKKGDIYEVVDYKTGKMPIESKLKKSLQLGLYALAVMDKQFLGIAQNRIILTYYYLDANKKFSIEASKRDLDEVTEEVVDTLATLETGNFPPQKGVHCDWCSFKPICPAWEIP